MASSPTIGRERNFAAVDSLVAQLAEIAEAAAVEHARQGQRGDPGIIFANEQPA